MNIFMVDLEWWICKSHYLRSFGRRRLFLGNGERGSYKKGDKEDSGKYRGITLLGAVGKSFCEI